LGDLATTYIDVEIGIVNIDAMGGLLEVDMGYSIGSHIVILHNTVGRSVDLRFDEVGSRFDVIGTLVASVRGRLSDGGIDVLSGSFESESVEVNATTNDAVAARSRWMCSNEGKRDQTGQQRSVHVCRLGTYRDKMDAWL